MKTLLDVAKIATNSFCEEQDLVYSGVCHHVTDAEQLFKVDPEGQRRAAGTLCGFITALHKARPKYTEALVGGISLTEVIDSKVFTLPSNDFIVSTCRNAKSEITTLLDIAEITTEALSAGVYHIVCNGVWHHITDAKQFSGVDPDNQKEELGTLVDLLTVFFNNYPSYMGAFTADVGLVAALRSEVYLLSSGAFVLFSK